ncbi:MAG TPA: hypothetical protein VFF49_06555 [Thermodesulfobacteriota bacterium]|nr:hypothetical protein [Thermodesulfobacteriota bacterium]
MPEKVNVNLTDVLKEARMEITVTLKNTWRFYLALKLLRMSCYLAQKIGSFKIISVKVK